MKNPIRFYITMLILHLPVLALAAYIASTVPSAFVVIAVAWSLWVIPTFFIAMIVGAIDWPKQYSYSSLSDPDHEDYEGGL